MPDSKTISDKIKEYRDFKGFKKSQFDTMCGLSNGYLNSVNTPSAEKLEQILRVCSDLSREWVLGGEGNMIKDSLIGATTELGKKLANINSHLNSESDPEGVPYWNLPVSAGRSIVDITGKIKPDGYIKGLPGADIAEHILPVAGASMEPEISSGAIIGVRKMNNWDTLNTERVYLIITHDDRMIKRIEHDETDMAILWCVSPNYPKFKIYKTDIVEIQRVCFVYNPK